MRSLPSDRPIRMRYVSDPGAARDLAAAFDLLLSAPPPPLADPGPPDPPAHQSVSLPPGRARLGDGDMS